MATLAGWEPRLITKYNASSKMAIEAIKTRLPWGGDQLAMGDRLRLQVQSGDAAQVRESWEQITQPRVNT